MSKKFYEVFGLGQCAWDYIGQIEEYPSPDMKCEMSSMVVRSGGPVATAMVALSRWGFSCTISSVIGDDLFGQQIISSLHNEHVNTESTFIRKGYVSQFAFIPAEKNSGRRTIFWHGPTGPPLKPEELDFERLRKSHVLHTDGIFPEASIAAAKTAREAGIPVVVDAGTLREGMLELARFSNYYIVSEQFGVELIGENNPREACKELQKLGPEVVGVTLGSKGYIILSEEGWIKRPAYSVNTVDTTGCGDIFHAGISYGILKNWSLEKILDFAAWAAAQVSTQLGGQEGIPKAEDYGKSI